MLCYGILSIQHHILWKALRGYKRDKKYFPYYNLIPDQLIILK